MKKEIQGSAVASFKKWATIAGTKLRRPDWRNFPSARESKGIPADMRNWVQIPPHLKRWTAILLRLIVGYGFMEHGYAKIMHGPAHFAAILHAMGVPAPEMMAWLTILTELIGGAAVLLGVFIPLASVPMAAVGSGLLSK